MLSLHSDRYLDKKYARVYQSDPYLLDMLAIDWVTYHILQVSTCI